jgi:hypothetical protein
MTEIDSSDKSPVIEYGGPSEAKSDVIHLGGKPDKTSCAVGGSIISRIGGKIGGKISSLQTCLMGIIVIALVVYILYYSYSCFCENQDFDEAFIEKTVKTGTEDDKSFDVDAEIVRLSDLQEKYLEKINSKRSA